VPGAGSGPVVHNHSRQIVETAARIREPRPGQILQQVAGHVQAIERKLDENVQFGARVRCPAETFDVQAEHVGQPTDPELLGGGLLGLAHVAEESLRVGEFFHFDKLLETVVDVADGRGFAVLRLPNWAYTKKKNYGKWMSGNGIGSATKSCKIRYRF
jgi:hypothetical protein